MPPWEKYQDAPSEAPWTKYGGAAVAEPDPEQPASFADRMVGGMGARFLQGVASPVLAGVQLLGGEKGRELVAELDAMKKRGMKASGNEGFDIAGLLGSLAPGAGIAKGVTAALPAATSALGKIGVGGLIGAATSAAQPVAPSQDFWMDKAKQVGLGGVVGAAIPAVTSALAAMRGAPRMTPTQAQTLAEGQAAGYVVQPSKVNPSFLNNRLESVAGKAAVGQEAAMRNQEVTNALAAKELGIAPGTPLSERALENVRKTAGATYTDVSNLSPKAEWALEELKKARHEVTSQFNYYNKSGNPDILTKAKEAKAWAGLLENELNDEATKAGRTDLVQALADARMKIAKSYDIEKALNLGNENVSATILGKQLDKAGSAAKSGDLAVIGKMEQAFPQAMREGSRVPSSGVSGTDAAMSAVLGIGGAASAGPMGLIAGGLPLLRGPARNLVLSKGYQKFATQGLSPQRQAMIDAIMQHGAGAAGTTAGRTQ